MPDRVSLIDDETINRELNRMVDTDMDLLARAYIVKDKYPNKINSSIVYCLGLSDNYDITKEVQMSGGSPPDI